MVPPKVKLRIKVNITLYRKGSLCITVPFTGSIGTMIEGAPYPTMSIIPLICAVKKNKLWESCEFFEDFVAGLYREFAIIYKFWVAPWGKMRYNKASSIRGSMPCTAM
jgi:hypothetical protein